MHDPNLPPDYIEPRECLHDPKTFLMDAEGGMYCPICDGDEEDESADFSGVSDEPGYAPNR